jgi:hypothetical protein
MVLSSCGGNCDTSTVQGASNCLCNLIEENVNIDPGDEEKTNAMIEKRNKIKKEIEQAIEDGKYSAEKLADMAGSRGCM